MNNAIDNLSTAELKAALAQRTKQERAAKEKAKRQYEEQRDKAVAELFDDAEKVYEALQNLKQKAHEVMSVQHDILSGYGGIRANSLGGFSIESSDAQRKIVRRRDTQPVWDERSKKGIEMVKSFLEDKIKGRDKKLFEILTSLLERNTKGDLEYSKVMHLLKHEDKYEDDRWVKGLQLIKEGYASHLRGFGYEFKMKDQDDKYQTLALNFSAV